MRLTRFAGVIAGLCACINSSAQAVESKKSLTLDGAKTVLNACEAAAHQNHVGGVIAVVDDGGNLIALHRIDGTFAAGANISIGKARTAAMFKKPTRAFEEIIKNGRTAMVALNDFTPLQGGVPITIDGAVVGAVGVSGAASAQQDEEIAMAGAASIEKSAQVGRAAPAEVSEVAFFDRDRVAAAFATGTPLFTGDQAVNCSVNPSRRDQSGLAEVHRDEADVMYVQEGAATLITGGTMVNPKLISSVEERADAIEGGQARSLTKGDVIIIPRGVPHWFKEVNTPLLYYVVKVRS